MSVDEAKRKAYLTWIKPNWKGEELIEDEKKELENLNKLDKERDQILLDNCSLGNISSSACKVPLQEATEMQKEYAQKVARGLTNSDLYGEDSKDLNEALNGLDPNSIINLIAIEAIAKETGQDVKEVAQRYKYVMAVHGIVSSLAGVYGSVKLTSPSKSGVDTIYHVEEAPNTRVIVGNNAGKGTAANKPLDQAALEAQHGKGNVTQGGGNTLATKETVTGNITESQKGTASSTFKEQHTTDGKIANAENISTAKPGKQFTQPRDLNEQAFWKQIESNPLQGKELPGMNNDIRFPTYVGFQKMETKHTLPDGQKITIHYQYNSITGKAYDMKITTPQRCPTRS